LTELPEQGPSPRKRAPRLRPTFGRPLGRRWADPGPTLGRPCADPLANPRADRKRLRHPARRRWQCEPAI